MLLFEIYVEIKIKKINPSPRTLLYICHVTILTVLRVLSKKKTKPLLCRKIFLNYFFFLVLLI